MAPIVTARLVLRRLQLADLAGFLAYQSHPLVRQFMRGEAMDEASALKFIEQQATMSDEARDAYHAFAVTVASDGRLIGDVGLYLPSGQERLGDLGFQFAPSSHGQGYATEACQALIQRAFEVWHLDRITSSCDRENVRSSRLMERLGMSPIPSTSPDELSFELLR